MAVNQTEQTAQSQASRPTHEELVAFAEACRNIRYSPKADILYLYQGTLEPGFTVEPGGCLAYRLSFDKKRIVAIELHNFRALVVRGNPQLALAWKEYSNPLRRWLRVQDRGLRFLISKVAHFVDSCDLRYS